MLGIPTEGFVPTGTLFLKDPITYLARKAILDVSRRWGPFLEGPETFSDSESHNKNLKL